MSTLDAYIRTALWSSNDESTEQGGEPFDRNYDASDLAPETLVKMQTELDAFLAQAEDMIGECGFEQAAHDFWLTRNGHGAGFWDGDWPKNGDKLTELSKGFGEVDLYLGDDGKIYQTP